MNQFAHNDKLNGRENKSMAHVVKANILETTFSDSESNSRAASPSHNSKNTQKERNIARKQLR